MRFVGLMRTVHAWCGVVLAAGLMVVGLTGAVSAFQPEILKFGIPAARGPAPDSASFGHSLDRFEASRSAKVAVASFSEDGTAVSRLNLTDGGQVFIDAVGASLGPPVGAVRLSDKIRSFHHTFLAGRKGELTAAAFGLSGLVMVLTGVVIWWPARRAFRGRPWPRSTRRSDLLASHRDIGVILAVLFLGQMMTGPALVFDGALTGALAPSAPPPAAPPATPGEATAGRWAPVLAAATRATPGAKLLMVLSPDEPGQPYTVLFRAGESPLGGTIQTFVGADAHVLRVDYPRTGPVNRLLDAREGLHGGTYAGLASRMVVACTGLGLALASCLGAWAFLRRLMAGARAA